MSSGLGGVYPRGIPIGIVISDLKTAEGFAKNYLIRPMVNPPDISSVFVLTSARARAGVSNVWAIPATADSARKGIAAAGDSIRRGIAAAAADSVRRRLGAAAADSARLHRDTTARKPAKPDTGRAPMTRPPQ